MPDKKEPLKKLTKDDWIKFNEWVNEKEKDINSDYFRSILDTKNLALC